MRCIFCMTEKPESELSVEHIFPESIGGTVTIRDVCKTCNDYLGRKVDFHLTNHWLVQFPRLIYKISGKKGAIPNPFQDGFLDGDPSKPVNYRFNKDGTPKDVYMVKQVNTQEDRKGGLHLNLSIDKSEEKDIPTMINKILERKGLPKFSSEELEAKIDRKDVTIPTPSILLKPSIDTIQFKRAIFKIIYELSYYWLGETYLEDNIAKQLRKVIFDDSAWDRKNLDEYDIQGQITIGSELPLWNHWRDDEISHLAFMEIYGEDIIVCVRLFNIFFGVILVSNKSSDYPQLVKKFIGINPVTKKIRDSTFEEELLRIVRSKG